VRWLHEKSKEFGGPVGGDGGRGGDVIFRAVRDVNTLARYRGKNEFRAEKGDDGKGKNMAGKDGESVFIDVPVGSVVTRLESGHTFELLNENDTVVGLHGGRGGLGNANFKSSTNQYPTESTEGAEGEEDEFLIEVKLIADAGLIGLPNAGKSSLLNKDGEVVFVESRENNTAFPAVVAVIEKAGYRRSTSGDMEPGTKTDTWCRVDVYLARQILGECYTPQMGHGIAVRNHLTWSQHSFKGDYSAVPAMVAQIRDEHRRASAALSIK
jgi:hypothetical protein